MDKTPLEIGYHTRQHWHLQTWHLTGRGRKRIGDTLADVLLREYDLWRIDNPEIFWNPEESIADPTGDLWEWECDNPEPSRYELLMNELEKEDVCKL